MLRILFRLQVLSVYMNVNFECDKCIQMCPSALVRSCESCFWTQRFCLLPWPRWSCFNLDILPIAKLFTNHTKVCRVDSRELRLSPLMVLAGVAYQAMPCDAASKFLPQHGAGLHTGLIIGGVSKSLRLRMTNIANICNYHQISPTIFNHHQLSSAIYHKLSSTICNYHQISPTNFNHHQLY